MGLFAGILCAQDHEGLGWRLCLVTHFGVYLTGTAGTVEVGSFQTAMRREFVSTDSQWTVMMKRMLRNFFLAIVWMSLSMGLPLLAQEEPGSIAYTCEVSAATLQPPQASPPVLHAVGDTQSTARDDVQRLAAGTKLRALCSEGKVPVRSLHDERYFHKGNPRFGSYAAPGPERALPKEFVNEYMLRPFDEVYRKDAGKGAQSIRKSSISHNTVAPICNGNSYFNSCYYYASSAERSTADGGGMSLGIELPVDVETGTGGGHSIGELAVEGSGSGLNDVEMGFNVSLDQYRDNKVHLFVYHWINGGETCYDTCAWNQYSNTYFPGMDISSFTGQAVYMGWVHGEGAWWAWFNDQWLGYINDTEWSGAFTQSVLIQWYGEVSTSNGVPPITQMGNGQFSSSLTSASMATLCNADASTWLCNYDNQQSGVATYPSYYDILNHSSFGAFRYGGSGQPGVTTPLVTITPSSKSILPTQTLNITIAVNGGTGNPTPTGMVTLASGSYVSTATALPSGSVSISIPAGSLAQGADAVAATYTPDNASSSTYESARNAAVVTVTGLPVTVFTPPAGEYATAQAVAISDSAVGATIYYTTDGTAPTTASTMYTGAIPVSATETIDAIAVSAGFSSAVASAKYTIAPGETSGLQFVPVTPCRIVDTRNATGAFGGPELASGAVRAFNVPQSACGIPATAVAYSLNATVVPIQSLGYLTVWPAGEDQPVVSTLNSDGRVKANATITPAGTDGGVSVYASDATQFILDIDGYFVPAGTASGLEFFPLAPCRVADTRNATGALGGPFLAGNAARAFPVQSSACAIPSTAKAYALNITAVPHGSLGFLSAWPSGQTQPVVSTLNASTGAVTANAAIVPAGSGGDVSILVSDAADVILDVNGYFAPPATGGLQLYTVTPCRVLDTRGGSGAFDGMLAVDVRTSNCAPPTGAEAYVLNATVVPASSLSYLTLWSAGGTQPDVSTLNAADGAVTSNMAIVPTSSGSIDAFSTDSTHLILDLSSYFAP
jgi:Chitobiase/beta-hexosaminidase C-terminal domain/Neprosin